jgi:uncharacterized protein (TIGR00369 family)
MPSEKHYRALETMYHHANCNAYYRPRLSISEGHAEIVIPVAPNLFHAAHAVHGSVYFKAMDDSAFFAANSLVPDVFVLTVSFSVYFTRPVTEGEMRGVARVVHQTKSLFTAEAVVTDSDGIEVGRGMGQFARSRIALDEKVGYVL